MVEDGQCVVVGDRKCKEIGGFRDEEPEEYEHVGVHGFYFKEPVKADRIEFLRLTQQLFYGYCYEHLRVIN